MNNKHLCVHKEEVHIHLIALQCVYSSHELGFTVQRFHSIDIDLFSSHSVQLNLTHGLHTLNFDAFTANKILLLVFLKISQLIIMFTSLRGPPEPGCDSQLVLPGQTSLDKAPFLCLLPAGGSLPRCSHRLPDILW